MAGSHTVGLARCTTFRGHIYNDSDIDPCFAKSLQQICPRSGKDSVLAPLDLQTPTCFDNLYYKNLLERKGLLHSDQELFNGNSADSLVRKYASNPSAFFKDFARAMVKMGNIKPLTGSQGEVRKNCRKVNWMFHSWQLGIKSMISINKQYFKHVIKSPLVGNFSAMYEIWEPKVATAIVLWRIYSPLHNDYSLERKRLVSFLL